MLLNTCCFPRRAVLVKDGDVSSDFVSGISAFRFNMMLTREHDQVSSDCAFFGTKFKDSFDDPKLYRSLECRSTGLPLPQGLSLQVVPLDWIFFTSEAHGRPGFCYLTCDPAFSVLKKMPETVYLRRLFRYKNIAEMWTADTALRNFERYDAHTCYNYEDAEDMWKIVWGSPFEVFPTAVCVERIMTVDEKRCGMSERERLRGIDHKMKLEKEFQLRSLDETVDRMTQMIARLKRK